MKIDPVVFLRQMNRYAHLYLMDLKTSPDVDMMDIRISSPIMKDKFIDCPTCKNGEFVTVNGSITHTINLKSGKLSGPETLESPGILDIKYWNNGVANGLHETYQKTDCGTILIYRATWKNGYKHGPEERPSESSTNYWWMGKQINQSEYIALKNNL